MAKTSLGSHLLEGPANAWQGEFALGDAFARHGHTLDCASIGFDDLSPVLLGKREDAAFDAYVHLRLSRAGLYSFCVFSFGYTPGGPEFNTRNACR
jgi:hypothetical protein